MKPNREVVFPAQEGVEVAALWYGEPHNVWRTEIRCNDEVIDNMTLDETAMLAEAVLRAVLLQACAP